MASHPLPQKSPFLIDFEMMDFFEIISQTLAGPLLKRAVRYVKNHRFDIEDRNYKRFYEGLVQYFLTHQTALNANQAKEFFFHSVTYDTIRNYLCLAGNPEPKIRKNATDALLRWADSFEIGKDDNLSNRDVIKHFLISLSQYPHKPAGLQLAYVQENLQAATLQPRRTLNSAAQRDLWHVPYDRNPNFSGRDAILATLNETLNTRGQAVITQTAWQGGVGKTQIAIEYAHRHKPSYQTVWWVQADTPETLLKDYCDFIRAAGLPEQPAVEEDSVIDAVRSWFNQHSNWLLILDNAPSPNALKNIIPDSTRGHILITSRHQRWGTKAETTLIGPWTRRESLAFLAKRAGQIDASGANAIAQALGDLPLAMALAAAHIEHRSKTCAEYLGLYKARAKELWQKENTPGNHLQTVSTTWNLAIEAVKSEIPVAAFLLNLCAFLAPDDIPREFLSPTNEHLPPSLRNSDAINNSIAALKRYSLMETKPKSLSVHRLVQMIVRDNLSEELKKAFAQVTVASVTGLWPGNTSDKSLWPRCERILPHSRACVGHAEKLGAESRTLGTLLNSMGSYLTSRAAYAAAKPLCRRALQIAERQPGPDAANVTVSLNNLAKLHNYLGNLVNAEPLFRRALRITEMQYGPTHRNVAISLTHLAQVLDELGDFANASPLYRRALQITEAQLGPSHADVAVCLHNLANLLYQQGNYQEAEPLCRRALQISEAQLGLGHPNVGANLNTLAELLLRLGKYAEAEPLYRRALEIVETQLGPNHPTVGVSSDNLAELLQAQGQYEAAESFRRRAVEILELQLGPDHPSVATGLSNLASVLQNLGKYREAEQLYHRGLKILQGHSGPNRLRIVPTLNKLACLLCQQGKYSEAEQLYSEALEITEAQLGGDHLNIACNLHNLAITLCSQAKYVDAEPLFRRALDIREHKLGAKHPNTLKIRKKLTMLLHKKGTSRFQPAKFGNQTV